MTAIRTRLLLKNLAHQSYLEKRKFSVNEIEEKIKQIKYLTTSGEYNPDTIIRELNNLHQRTSFISHLEKELLRKKKLENNRIKSLKQENEKLKKKVSIAGNKNFDKKIKQLSHLLGDYLAKYGTSKDIEVTNKLLSDFKVKKEIKLVNEKVESKTEIKQKNKPKTIKKKKEKIYYLTQDDLIKLRIAYNRLKMLKHQLNIYRNREVNPKTILLYDKKLALVEEKINEFSEKYLTKELSVKASEVNYDFKSGKHTMMFEDVLKSEKNKFDELKKDINHELPLPPPPGFKR